MNKAYIFVNKDNTILISNKCPKRCGSTKVKNNFGEKIKQKYIGGANNKIVTEYYKVNAFRPDDELIEVHGYEGSNTLWDHGDDAILGTFEITKDDCFYWSIHSGAIKISESTCIKLFGFVPTWDNDPIEVEI